MGVPVNPYLCGSTSTSCCPSGYQDMLHVTLRKATCPDIDGKVADVRLIGITPTAGGDRYTWQGPVANGQSLGTCGSLYVTVDIIPAAGCLWAVAVQNESGGLCLSAVATHVASCPLTNDAFSGIWDSVNCPCCSGSVTVHVSP